MAGIITSLEVQKRNHQRLNVYLDGEYAFGLSRFVGAWLQVGQELFEEKISELLEDDSQEIAYQLSIRFIDYRLRTSSEVEKHLRKKGIQDQVINSVIERLEKNGLLNDENFAKTWIENRSEFFEPGYIFGWLNRLRLPTSPSGIERLQDGLFVCLPRRADQLPIQAVREEH